MNDKPNILSEKIGKWAFGFNSLIVIGLFIASYNFWQLGTNDLEGSTKQITVGTAVVITLLAALSAGALFGFYQNNKLSKIYFMLIAVFGFPFSGGYAQTGFFVMVFLIVALFVNIGCYRKMHPQK